MVGIGLGIGEYASRLVVQKVANWSEENST
jgi:hypothetical protein